MPYVTVSLQMTLTDLAKYPMTRSVARSLCDSWASCSDKMVTGKATRPNWVENHASARHLAILTFWIPVLDTMDIYCNMCRPGLVTILWIVFDMSCRNGFSHFMPCPLASKLVHLWWLPNANCSCYSLTYKDFLLQLNLPICTHCTNWSLSSSFALLLLSSLVVVVSSMKTTDGSSLKSTSWFILPASSILVAS